MINQMALVHVWYGSLRARVSQLPSVDCDGRRRAGTGGPLGPQRRHNEYLRALVGDFSDAQADRIIDRYDAFATRVMNIELPVWWYSAGAASIAQLMRCRPLARC